MWPSKNYNTNKNNNHKRKPTAFNYFVLPTSVTLPKFPIPNDLICVVLKNLKPYPGMTEKSVQFLRLLERIKNPDELILKESNHLKILKFMLYLEEIQNNLDMRRYDQFNKPITRVSSSREFFKITVEGMAEELPSIRPNDEVEVRDSRTKTLYVLRVTNVLSDHIIATGGRRFQDEHSISKLYNIRFRWYNYTIRCSHYALSLVNLYQLMPNFYPTKRVTFNNSHSHYMWFNKEIENNPRQKQAVLQIVGKTSFPAPYILYGPPGTGKTATVCEAVCQVWQNNPSEHILICTPSNAAADVITKRLLNYIPEHNLYRMYSPSKEGSQIDDAIIGCSNYVDGQIMMLPKELVILKNVVICTLCACTRLLFFGFRERHFSYIFIDEAGQATEPESMIPFNLVTSAKEGRIGRLHSQIIISGDPQQLGPGIRSKYAEPILGKSLMERLMKCEPYIKDEHNQYNPSYITKLLQNYRSHPDIIRIPNDLFYDNELIACDSEKIYAAEDWGHLVQRKFPVIFHGVAGTEQKDLRSPSVYNVEEVKVIVQYVRLLMGTRFKNGPVRQQDIGIVTPFSAQRKKLHGALQEAKYTNIDVGTVELFQGQEKNVIILSTVRSKTFFHDKHYHIGFLSNPKRFNVALTRAKCLLIVVGDPQVLQIDKQWWKFLSFCKRNNACRGVGFNIKSEFEYKTKNFRRNNAKNKDLSGLFDNNLEVVQIDDGILESSDDSVVDENDYPKPSAKSTAHNHFNKYHASTANSNPRNESLLSDLIMKKFSEMNIDSTTKKKNKKKKNKCVNEVDFLK